MTKLLFVPGSLRSASASRATVRALIERLRGDAESVVADIGRLPLYNADLTDDPAVAAWIEQIDAADGVVFVTPEYNYSVPGVLKNGIDWASRPAYESVFKDKKSLVLSVSGGALGGVRAQAHLKQILNAMLGEVFVCKEIVIPNANTKVENGILMDEAILGFAEENLRAFVTSLEE